MRGAVLLISVLWASASAYSSYSTKCFAGCHCNANTIECINLRNRNASFLQLISTNTFPELRYLIVTGAEFLDLPESNMFGFNVHHNLRHINFTDCRITSIGIASFSGVPNLRLLYLAKNQLREAHPDALKQVPNLEAFDLSENFDVDRINNKNVLQNLFSVPLQRLQNIYLRGNNLRFNVGYLFCKFRRLLTLDLSENRLQHMSTPEECTNSSVSKLNLAFNDFTTPPMLDFPLNDLDLHGNPLDCEEIYTRPNVLQIMPRLNTTTCSTPLQYRGIPIQTAVEAMRRDELTIQWALVAALGVVTMALVCIAASYCKRNHKARHHMEYSLVQMQEVANAEFL